MHRLIVAGRTTADSYEGASELAAFAVAQSDIVTPMKRPLE